MNKQPITTNSAQDAEQPVNEVRWFGWNEKYEVYEMDETFKGIIVRFALTHFNSQVEAMEDIAFVDDAIEMELARRTV